MRSNAQPLIQYGPGAPYLRLVREEDISRTPAIIGYVAAAFSGLFVGCVLSFAVYRFVL